MDVDRTSLATLFQTSRLHFWLLVMRRRFTDEIVHLVAPVVASEQPNGAQVPTHAAFALGVGVLKTFLSTNRANDHKEADEPRQNMVLQLWKRVLMDPGLI